MCPSRQLHQRPQTNSPYRNTRAVSSHQARLPVVAGTFSLTPVIPTSGRSCDATETAEKGRADGCAVRRLFDLQAEVRELALGG